MEEKIITQEDGDAFMKMPEKRKKKLVEKLYFEMLNISKKQLDYIDDWKDESDEDKEIGHIYVFATVKNFWENIELALFLGKKSYANFSVYPIRLCVETFMQFSYFSKQNQEKKDKIAYIEMLRPCYYLYKAEVHGSGNSQQYLEFYNLYAPLVSLPGIDDVRASDLKIFPTIEALFHSYNEETVENNYFLYRQLCETVHGKLLGITIRHQSMESQEFRRYLLYIYNFCKEMLVVLDECFLESKFKKEVEICINDLNNTFMKSIKKYK